MHECMFAACNDNGWLCAESAWQMKANEASETHADSVGYAVSCHAVLCHAVSCHAVLCSLTLAHPVMTGQKRTCPHTAGTASHHKGGQVTDNQAVTW